MPAGGELRECVIGPSCVATPRLLSLAGPGSHLEPRGLPTTQLGLRMGGQLVWAETQMPGAWSPSALWCWTSLCGPCGSSDVNQALVRPQLWSQPDGGQGLGTICRKPLLLNSTLGPSLAPFTPEQSKADRAWLGGDGVYCFEVIGQVTHPHQEERQTPWAGPGRPGRANSCIPPLETAGAWERGRATPGRSRSSTRLLPPWEG